jgi:hypothetical protein
MLNICLKPFTKLKTLLTFAARKRGSEVVLRKVSEEVLK